MLTKLTSLLNRKFSNRATGENSLRDTIEELIEEKHHEPDSHLDMEEKSLLTNVLKLRDITVENIQTPRADIVSIDITTPIEEAQEIYKKTRYTRLLVHQRTIDHILGFMHVVDVLASPSGKTLEDLSSCLKELLFVPYSMRVLDLLYQMRGTRIPIAVVVDEYGGTDGLVTSSDIVHEIVGKIDLDLQRGIHEEDKVTYLSDGSAVVNARMPLQALEEEYGHILTKKEREQEELDTVGGLVSHLAGRVPAPKEILAHESGLEFEVLEADPRRVKQVRIYKPNGLDNTKE